MSFLILVRHGESIWNKENKFTGWVDVPLSGKGIAEAKKAGQVLKKEGFVFDLVFTSVLRRANETLDFLLKEMRGECILNLFSFFVPAAVAKLASFSKAEIKSGLQSGYPL